MFGDIFGDYFNAYKQTGRYRDDGMLEVALRKKNLRNILIKCGVFTQLGMYLKL